MLARRVPLLVLTTIFSLTAWAQTNTAAGAGTYPAQPEPNSTASLGVRPEVLPWDTGEAGLHLLAKKLKNTGRIMHLTAHPDDEDGALLTYLSRGQGRQVLLMSLTRGEGGQNRTGSNLWDELGVLRTLELLESTRYYGTELRFSRVADFGFSKSADETFQKWGGHQVPLRDIVYVIREWKPDVLFTRFSGTPRDGHGMHQASAILAPEAVKCAADPNCFPDQLKGDHALTTWQVLKLYMGNQGGDYTVRYDVSQIDPDTKLSYTQMALEGFKHQASQLSGNFTPPSGPNWRSYKLVSTTIPNYKPEKEQDFFDGIDTSLSSFLEKGPEPSRRALAKLPAEPDFDRSPKLLLQFAKESRDFLQNQFARPGAVDVTFWRIAQKIEESEALANLLVGLTVQARASTAEAVQNSNIEASVEVKNGDRDIELLDADVSNNNHCSLHDPANRKERIEPKAIKTQSVFFTACGRPSRQHWVRRNPETDTVYTYTDSTLQTLPLPGAPFTPFADYIYQGERGHTAAHLLGPDGASVAIVPAVSVTFAHIGEVIPSETTTFETEVSVRAVQTLLRNAIVSLVVPAGWKVSPKTQTVNLGTGEVKRLRFTVRPSQRKQQSVLSAQVQAAERMYSEGFSRVWRSDLQSLYYYQPAIQRVSIVNVNVPKNLRVGYIPGAGDDIFPVLQQLGLNARQISNDELAKGDLHQYDTIVVGIRGYDERPEIRANNQRLLDFVNDGGTLLVQNQKDELLFNSSKFTPYPATLGRQRVSVEEAPVTVLAPNDSIFNSPNKITQGDFDGWVQERGINFMSDWDAKFEPLLASNDPGEQPLKGGLLRAKYGKGTYIYTGYAFFRQLPAGVPGAVRLYVNLLNAGHEAK